MEVSPFDLYFEEVSMVGTFALTQESFERAVTLLRNDRIRTDPLVTEEIGLDGLPGVFEGMENTEGLKNLVVPGRTD